MSISKIVADLLCIGMGIAVAMWFLVTLATLVKNLFQKAKDVAKRVTRRK